MLGSVISALHILFCLLLISNKIQNVPILKMKKNLSSKITGLPNSLLKHGSNSKVFEWTFLSVDFLVSSALLGIKRSEVWITPS